MGGGGGSFFKINKLFRLAHDSLSDPTQGLRFFSGPAKRKAISSSSKEQRREEGFGPQCVFGHKASGEESI